jgi:DNA-binding response OmpR family regulator
MTPRRLHILLIDDDPKFRTFAAAGLEEHGHDVETAADADQALGALAAAEAATFDVVLLDIMMPGTSGWDLLAAIRARGLTLPVIFVTAREAVDERVRGLKLGADDYVIKPFAFAELVARIDAVVRRQRTAELAFGELRLDLLHRKATCGGRGIDLSPKEFDLLQALAEERGGILSRSELLRRIWGAELDPDTNVVDVHVGRLRRKLAAVEAPPIRTVRGAGYGLGAVDPKDPR